MKIRFLKPEKSRFGDWQPGDREDVDDTEAQRLIESGIAALASTPLMDSTSPGIADESLPPLAGEVAAQRP